MLLQQHRVSNNLDRQRYILAVLEGLTLSDDRATGNTM